LKAHEIRVLVDDGDDTVGKKIRNHRKLQPAYMVIVGDGETEGRTVSLRARNGDQISGMGLDEFILAIREEIDTKVTQPSLVVVESVE
jgi:threonyl-tRNA synthetase